MAVPEIQGIEIEAKIGTGGMATVWRGRQLNLDRPVAVKVMQVHWGDDPADVERFKAEARSAARLKHPSIIQVHDANFVEGCYYIVMEFVDGYTVADWLRRKETLSQKDALLIAECVAEGLLYAWHNAHMIHCDIKPDNVMVDGDGTVKIADLGLARTIDVLRPGSETEDDIMGTPAYMSPEQARGDSDLDCRADIYSLGCMLYHILTGKVPFDGMDVDEILAAQANDQLPDVIDLVSGVTKPMCALLQKMMAKDRELRQADWREVLQDIQRVRHGHLPIRVPPPEASTLSCSKKRMQSDGDLDTSVRARSRYGARRSRLLPAAMAVGIFLALISAVVYRVSQSKQQPVVAEVFHDEEVVLHVTDAAAIRDEQAQERYRAALALFERDPMDYEGAIRALRTVVSRYADTQYASLARADVQRISALKQNEIERVMSSLRQQSHEHAAKEAFDEAIALLLAYDGVMAAETTALREDEASALQRRREVHAADQREADALRRQRIDEAWGKVCKMLLDDGVAAALQDVTTIMEDDDQDDNTREQFAGIKVILSNAADLNRIVLQSFEREKGRKILVHLRTGRQELVILDVEHETGSVIAEQQFMIRGHHAARNVHISIHDLAPEEYARRAGRGGHLALQLVQILDTWSDESIDNLERQLAELPAPFSRVLFAQMHQRLAAGREVAARRFLFEGLQRLGMAVDLQGSHADWEHALREARATGSLPSDAVQLASGFDATYSDTQFAQDAAGILALLQRSVDRAAMPALREQERGAPLLARERRRQVLVADADEHRQQNDQIRSIMVSQNPDLFAMDIQIMRDSDSGEVKSIEIISEAVASLEPLSRISGLEELVCAGVNPHHVWRNRPIAPLRDLSPLRGFPLASLSVNNTSVRDLSPLRGMPLVSFNASHSQVNDISPLRNAPLEVILLRGTSVRDLSVLRGKPLTRVDVSNTSAFDFRPIASRTLTHFEASGTQLRDLSVLYGSPIRRLDISGSSVFDFSPLRDMPLEHLAADKTQIRDISVLHGKALGYLSLRETPIIDISALAGMPLTRLYIARTQVSDFSVLASLPLQELDVSHTRIVDLSPLSELPLRVLNLSHTRVRDLSPLSGLPLRTLNMTGVEFESLSPLAGMPIERLTIDNPERANVRNLLHRLPHLRFVNNVEWGL